MLTGRTRLRRRVPVRRAARAADWRRRHAAARQVEAAEPRPHGSGGHAAASPRTIPGNAHAIPYMWGTAGLGYNPAMVRESARHRNASTAGARCSTRPSRRSSRSAASRCWTRPRTRSWRRASTSGLDPNSEKREDLAAAEALLKACAALRALLQLLAARQRPGERRDLRRRSAGTGCILQARDRGAAAATPVEDRLCDAQGGLVHLVRHRGDTGRCAASRQCPCIPELPDGARGHRAASARRSGMRTAMRASREYPGRAHSGTILASIRPRRAMKRAAYRIPRSRRRYIREANRAWTRIKTGQ